MRGHLELSGITTVDDLAGATTLAAGRVAVALAALQHEGFALQGRYTADGRRTRSGCRAACWPACTATPGGRAGSRSQPATAQDFMRFLLRWQHVAPGTQLSGDAGLAAVIEQLQGFEAAAVAWEPELLGPPAPPLLARPGWTASATTARWPGCGWPPVPAARPTARPAAPSKATPIAVVFRTDLAWLLDAARAGAPPARPTVGATAEIVESPGTAGRLASPSDLAAGDPPPARRRRARPVGRRDPGADHVRRLRRHTGPGRRRPQPTARSPASSSRLGRMRPADGGIGRTVGAWFRSPRPGPSTAHDLAEAVAEQLLHRWGVVFRDLAVRDSLRLPWRELQWALRRLEDRGLVRGGRFVTGFSGEQYALPEAAEQLAHVRKTAAHRGAGDGQRHRSPQPGRPDRPGGDRSGRSDQPGHLRRRGSGHVRMNLCGGRFASVPPAPHPPRPDGSHRGRHGYGPPIRGIGGPIDTDCDPLEVDRPHPVSGRGIAVSTPRLPCRWGPGCRPRSS